MDKRRTFLRPVIDLEATGEKIKKIRKLSGYSVKDLQEIFGFEFPQAIYAWEQGKNVPTIDNLMILSSLYGVQIEDLIVVRNVEIELSCARQDTACAAKDCQSCRQKIA